MAISPLSPGTIVARQTRGIRSIQYHGRILDSFAIPDKLGRRQIWYQVQVLNTTLIARWPGSHCKPVAAAPT